MSDTAVLDAILAFLREIGVAVREEALVGDTFLPGIRITSGTLALDRTRLDWPGDLLHEAGHIALTPAAHRHELDDALTVDQHHPHGGEVEAIAWSYAAVMKLALPLEVLFHPAGYRGRAHALALSYSLGVHPGAAGLVALGLCAVGEQARQLGVAPYPHMLGWLRDG